MSDISTVQSAADTGDTTAGQPAANSTRRRSGGGLSGMVLAELQQVAGGLGIKGTGRMRKSQLIEAITAAQGSSSQPAASQSQASQPVASPPAPSQERNGAEAQTSSGTTASQPAATEPQPTQQPFEQPEQPAQARSERNGDRSNAQGGTRSDGDDRGNSRNDGDNRGNSRNDGDNRGNSRRDEEDGSRRSRRRRSRDRGRDRNDRNDRGPRQDSEPTVSDSDVLLPVAGIVDVLDSYAFVRTSGYLPGPDDVYVSLSMVRKHALRKGDAVTGQVKAREGNSGGGNDRNNKFNPLVRIETVNGTAVGEARQRVEFSKLTPLYAADRLRLETEASILTTRIIDIVAPIGKGQRGLIVSPSKAGKTLVLQSMANAITTNNPEVHLMVVLVDERPEEVTDMQRAVKGEVIASTFDRPATDHTTVAELAIERAKRLVELGHDVVVLLDSITRLGRAYNLAAPASGRILSGGVDSSALYPPKRFFGAARNIEDGGSLTILATALIETGSKMDEVIFEEFKGTGNMELRLRREYADKRIFPAIDVDSSGTRREELLMSREELQIVWKLRRVLSALDGQQALELLLDKLKKTRSNVEFLRQVQNTTPQATTGRRGDED